MGYLHRLKTLSQINITEWLLKRKQPLKRCSQEKQLVLDLQKLKERYFTNIGKIRESHVKNNQEGAQHLAVAASVTTK